MTKTLFRKLHMLECSMTTSTGAILCWLWHEYWGIFFIVMSLLWNATYKSAIEMYEKDWYTFDK